MDYKIIIRQFFFLFFAFFGLRVMADVAFWKTPIETANELYSLRPYVSALLFAVIITAYSYYLNRKKDKRAE